MEMEETQVPAPDPFIPPDVKAPKKSLTNRYSEIFRDLDNFQLSVYPGVEEPDPDSQSLPENSSEPSENPELENPENPECEDACCPEIRTDVCEKDGGLSAQDADLELCRCEGGVELALQYAKMWCRYAKDLLTWMDKRISLEQEFSKNIMKAAEAAKSCVAQQDMMPLRYIYTMALEQDVKNSASSRQTADLLQQRCYQGLAAKKNEIDKWRREFKEQWSKQQRRMNEAAAALKKARHQYLQRCEELEKAKAVTARAMDDTSGHKTLDRRRKSRGDAQLKVTEAEKEYRQCVSDAKANQEELERVKERIVVHTRKLICQGDTVLKETTVNMFYFQRLQTAPVPEGYHCLEVSCRPCQPGESYLDYILSRHLHEQPRPEFAFQEFVPQGKSVHRKTSNSTLHPVMDSDGRRARYSDPESMGGSWESLSSPAHVNRRLPKVSSAGTISSDDLDERDIGPALESEGADGPVCKLRPASRAALTHRLRKMKNCKMVKCKQCDNYIVVNGIECEECSLAVHRKCLEVCQLECEQRKGSLFGVDFPLLPRERPDQVPFLVLLCTAEIESRALAVQGVYRVSGSKPRVQKLCQAFEAQKEQVDLSDISPHDLTSVLKHFFKELPEPLLTFDLYNDFISVGKEIQHAAEREANAAAATAERIVLSLRELLRRLAPYRYSTLQHMMSHLHRVAENFEENKMSAGNLGIVFGPTLLRPLVSVDVSMVALLETSYQALLVEFLVAQHRRVFGLPERPCTPPPPPPTAPLPDTPPPRGTSCPPATEGGALTLPLGPQEPGNPSSRGERPRSLDTGTIKRDSSEGYISDKSSSNEAVDQLSAEANERAVLALRAAMAARPADLPVETDAPVGPRPPLYHLSKQPSEHRGHVPLAARAPRPRTGRPGGGGTPATSAERRTQTGSAESSRSSSPEPGIQRHAPHRQATNQTRPPPYESEPPPPQAVQERRGLGVASATAAAAPAHPTPRFAREEEGLGIQASSLANLNVNQSNNRLRVGERWSESRSTRARSGERTLTGPAQKILSGLKQRRCDSGKEQFHFV